MTKSKTYADFIKDHADLMETKRLVAAIEDDKKQKVLDEQGHPLRLYPYAPMRGSINPTA